MSLKFEQAAMGWKMSLADTTDSNEPIYHFSDQFRSRFSGYREGQTRLAGRIADRKEEIAVENTKCVSRKSKNFTRTKKERRKNAEEVKHREREKERFGKLLILLLKSI